MTIKLLALLGLCPPAMNPFVPLPTPVVVFTFLNPQHPEAIFVIRSFTTPCYLQNPFSAQIYANFRFEFKAI